MHSMPVRKVSSRGPFGILLESMADDFGAYRIVIAIDFLGAKQMGDPCAQSVQLDAGQHFDQDGLQAVVEALAMELCQLRSTPEA